MKLWEALKLIDQTPSLSLNNFQVLTTNRVVLQRTHENIISEIIRGASTQDDYIYELKLTREEKIKHEVLKELSDLPYTSQEQPIDTVIAALIASDNLKLKGEKIRDAGD